MTRRVGRATATHSMGNRRNILLFFALGDEVVEIKYAREPPNGNAKAMLADEALIVGNFLAFERRVNVGTAYHRGVGIG